LGMEMPKIKTRLEVNMLAGDGAAELYLYGVIRQAFWWDDEEEVISAKRVQKALQELKGKNIDVHINSPGGDVFESIAICNLLKQHDGIVNVYVDAIAASGASVVCTAGEKVFMFVNSMMFIHEAATYAGGNAAFFRKVADDLDKITDSARQSYLSKWIGTEEELDKLLAEETYLTAAECLAFGLCTEIIDAKPQEPEPQVSVKASLFAKYQKPPAPEGDDKKASLFNLFKK
jgi:ATP-dependent Clp protease protease subunit